MQGSSKCSRSPKKKGKQSIGKSNGGWNTKLHLVPANDKVIVEMHLSGGECHDAPQGRISIDAVGEKFPGVPMLMDRAYEGDETRLLVRLTGREPIVPPKKNRQQSWE
jgi:transposase